MATSFKEHLNERLKDPEFKAEWDALEPEYNIKLALINARRDHSYTQAQISAPCKDWQMPWE